MFEMYRGNICTLQGLPSLAKHITVEHAEQSVFRKLFQMEEAEVLRRRKLAAFVHDFLLRTPEQRIWLQFSEILEIIRKDLSWNYVEGKYS